MKYISRMFGRTRPEPQDQRVKVSKESGSAADLAQARSRAGQLTTQHNFVCSSKDERTDDGDDAEISATFGKTGTIDKSRTLTSAGSASLTSTSTAVSPEVVDCDCD